MIEEKHFVTSESKLFGAKKVIKYHNLNYGRLKYIDINKYKIKKSKPHANFIISYGNKI